MHLKFTVIKSLKTIKPAKGFIKWGVPISTHVAESTRKAAWGASAGGFGLYQWVPLKQQFRSNLWSFPVPFIPKGTDLAERLPSPEEANGKWPEGYPLRPLREKALSPREALVNKLSAAWVGSRCCCGHRLSGTRKLERSGTGQCHTSPSRVPLGAGLCGCWDVPGGGLWNVRDITPTHSGLYTSCFLLSALSSALPTPRNTLGKWKQQESRGRRPGWGKMWVKGRWNLLGREKWYPTGQELEEGLWDGPLVQEGLEQILTPR